MWGGGRRCTVKVGSVAGKMGKEEGGVREKQRKKENEKEEGAIGLGVGLPFKKIGLISKLKSLWFWAITLVQY